MNTAYIHNFKKKQRREDRFTFNFRQHTSKVKPFRSSSDSISIIITRDSYISLSQQHISDNTTVHVSCIGYSAPYGNRHHASIALYPAYSQATDNITILRARRPRLNSAKISYVRTFYNLPF